MLTKLLIMRILFVTIVCLPTQDTSDEVKVMKVFIHLILQLDMTVNCGNNLERVTTIKKQRP